MPVLSETTQLSAESNAKRLQGFGFAADWPQLAATAYLPRHRNCRTSELSKVNVSIETVCLIGWTLWWVLLERPCDHKLYSVRSWELGVIRDGLLCDTPSSLLCRAHASLCLCVCKCVHQWACVCICVSMCDWIWTCAYVCEHVWGDVCISVHTSVCVCLVWLYVSLWVGECVSLCMGECFFVCVHITVHVCLWKCMYQCVHVCLCVWVYVSGVHGWVCVFEGACVRVSMCVCVWSCDPIPCPHHQGGERGQSVLPISPHVDIITSASQVWQETQN